MSGRRVLASHRTLAFGMEAHAALPGLRIVAVEASQKGIAVDVCSEALDVTVTLPAAYGIQLCPVRHFCI